MSELVAGDGRAPSRPAGPRLVGAASPVRQTVALGPQWPTLDPFLFCAHHHDRYPAGDHRLAPAVSIDDRDLGQDFSGRDGWSMYHGLLVPGFPQHPHRGFETVTYVRTGLIDHADSLGAAARYGEGDVQWLTAGGGIVHAEMFPLLDREQPNPLELFQIWINLPAADKMAAPYFTMFWSEDQRRLPIIDGIGAAAGQVTVVAGELAGLVPPAPPPESWASRPDADVAIWHVHLEAGATWVMPSARRSDVNRVLYAFDGGPLTIADTTVAVSTGAVLEPDVEVRLTAGPAGADALLLQGRPIAEPVASYGPFVMTTRSEIVQAIDDYQTTGFGGWPWEHEAPTNGPRRERFAIHPGGRRDLPLPA